MDGVDLGFQLAGQGVFDGGFNDQLLGGDEIADGVVRLAGPGLLLHRQHLVPQRVLALVKQSLAGQGSQLDEFLDGTERKNDVLQMAFARPAPGEYKQGQRVVHLPARHHQVANQPVGFLAHQAQLFHVPQNLVHQIGAAPQLQRLGFVGVRYQDHGLRRLHLPFFHVSFQLHDEPVHVHLDHVGHFLEQVRRLADERAP